MQYQFHFLNRSGSSHERHWQGLNLIPSRSTCQTAGRSIRRTLARKSESLLASLGPFILYTSYIVRNQSSSRPTTSPSPTPTSPRSNRSRGTISRLEAIREFLPLNASSLPFIPPLQLHPYSDLTTVPSIMPYHPSQHTDDLCPLQLSTCQGQEPHPPTHPPTQLQQQQTPLDAPEPK